MAESRVKRTVEDILNLKTGEYIYASSLLDNMDTDDIVLLRRKLRTANREGNPILVCAECSTKLELRCNKLSRKSRGKDFYFFKHYKDVNECSIKTNSRLPAGVLLARKYANVRESVPHIHLKTQLGNIIKQYHSPEEISIDSKFYFDKSGNGEKRKPDVYAIIKGKEYAFEIQLNTTFLSVIEEREAFYEKNNVSVIWIFKHFPLNDNLQRLTQKDIYVPNRLNAFVFNEELIDLSIKEKKFHLRVYYKTFYDDGHKLLSQWRTDIITIDDLKYDKYFKPFFYDSFKDKENTKQKLEQKEKQRRLEQQRIQRFEQHEQERLVKQERINQRNISKCRTLINSIQAEIADLNNRESELLKDKRQLELKIDELQSKNQELSQKKIDIKVTIKQIYDYLRNYRKQSWQYPSIPLAPYCDISSIRDKYYELIQELENSKERIQTKLREEIIPRKSFIDKFITQNIDGIEYSIIPLEAKYENLINKYPEEIRVIETKELNTIFASDSIKSIPDTSLFSRCVRSRNDLYTFLMDMSVRKLDTLSKEEELNNQLKLISQNKSICMSELEAELIELLNNEVGVNVESIKEYKSEINKILNTLLNYSTRTDILRGRENTCKQYLCNYNMK